MEFRSLWSQIMLINDNEKLNEKRKIEPTNQGLYKIKFNPEN